MLGKALYEVRTYVFCNITSHHTTPQNIFNFFSPSCHSIIFYLSSTISKTRSCFASIITKLQDSFTHLLSFLPLRRLFIPSFPCLSLFTIFQIYLFLFCNLLWLDFLQPSVYFYYSFLLFSICYTIHSLFPHSFLSLFFLNVMTEYISRATIFISVPQPIAGTYESTRRPPALRRSYAPLSDGHEACCG